MVDIKVEQIQTDCMGRVFDFLTVHIVWAILSTTVPIKEQISTFQFSSVGAVQVFSPQISFNSFLVADFPDHYNVQVPPLL